jgi:hypothetical protein
MRAGTDVTLALEEMGLTVDGRMEFMLVTTGQIGSFVMTFAIGDPITDVQLEEWGELLLERQAAA